MNRVGKHMGAALTLMLALACVLAKPVAAQTTVEYIHTDLLGSVAVITDADAKVIERREYEPYGSQLTPAAQDGLGYTGHVQDAATGLVYMQQRYYDPLIGRFLSVDPVTAYDNGDMRHFNRYAYVFNNPYKFNDPDGRAPDWLKVLLGKPSDTHGAERAMSTGIADSLRGELRAAEKAFQAPQAFAQAVGDAVAPDYVTGEVGVSAAQGNLTYSKNGTLFIGGGVSMTNPSSMADAAPGGSVTFGFVLGESAGPAVDAFLQGGSASYGGCYVVCAGLRINEGGSALEFGLGSPGIKVPAIEGATQVPVELPAWR